MKQLKYLLFIFLMAFLSLFHCFCNMVKKPRISIITSVFKADEFIENFLKDITRQTIFDQCELIIVNANSPGNEDILIKKYADQYHNIKYYKLDVDPGLYGVWNYAIKKAEANLITNANVDDRRNPAFLEIQAQALEEDASIDLVYSRILITKVANEWFENNSHYCFMDPPEFKPELIRLCLPGAQPMWRKSLHTKYGFFNPSFTSSGDWEMWLRAVSQGAKFKKIAGISGLYYENPEGLSTRPFSKKAQEDDNIIRRYGYLWNVQPNTFRLLIKIPTRARPEKFFATLDNYYKKLSGHVPYHFIISCDNNDTTMNNPEVIERLRYYPNLSYYFNDNTSKVEAYNNDIYNHPDFDVLLVVSDDMEPIALGYDKIIIDTMKHYFPDTDGVLNFHDGHVGQECNTLPILGKKFYQRFGYIYHPSYKSLCCDVELTLVSRALTKEYISNEVIIQHNHPVFGLNCWDQLYEKNEIPSKEDRANFYLRQAHNFYLD